LAKRWRHRQRGEPRARTIRANDAHLLRQRRWREGADHEARREKRCQCDLPFSAKRRSSDERGERAESETW
jgi:hypothetical protein